MTDKKITNLTNIVAADLVDADEFVVVDISADETMALTLGELKTAVGGGAGDLLAANNLSDLADAGTARTNLGLGTTDSPTFAGLTTTADVSFGDNVTVSGIQPKITITETDTSAQHRILSSSGALYIQAEDSDGTDDGDLHLTGMSNNDLRVLNIKAANTYINGNLDVTGDVAFADGGKATFGAGDDLQIFHSGTSSFIRDVGGGDLQIFASDDVFIRGYDTSSYMARFAEAGAVTLYHNNVEKFATSSTGVEVTGNATFADNGKATFGAGADLQIFHSGTASWIRDLGTGGLVIDTNGTAIDLKGSSPTEYMARFLKDGAVSLYYDNAEKLATTSEGVDVTGGLEVSGSMAVGTTAPWTTSGGWRAIKMTDRHAIQATPSADAFAVSSNSAIGASGWEYTQTGVTASNYTLSGNIHLWNTAASGTDGGAVTFTERMRLNTTGLGIGTNNPSAKLDVVGNAEINGNLNVTGTVTATAFIGESPSVFSIRDEKSVNVAAQYLPANTWTHHNLQTTDVNTLTGASLAANVITLPAGTFDVYASTQSYRGNGSKARLYDITNSATLLASTSNASHSSFYSGVTEQIIGRITVASGGITCRLEQNVTTASYAGINVNKTEPEIYSYVKFTEVT